MKTLEQLLANREPIAHDASRQTLGDAEYANLFKDLQSGILTSQGHTKATYWFVEFPVQQEKFVQARFLLGMLARPPVERKMMRDALDAASQRDTRAEPVSLSAALAKMAELWKQGATSKLDEATDRMLANTRVFSEHEIFWKRNSNTVRDDVSVNVLLTKRGYDKLAVVSPADAAFQNGMQGRLPEDPEPDWRDTSGQAVDPRRIDALLVVTYSGDARAQLDALKVVLQKLATLVVEEQGELIWAEDEADGKQAKYAVEPFGFRDSISQPAFFAVQADEATQHWDPSAPLELALVRDPNGKLDVSCGSYFVFRKLEQNIRAFFEQAAALADKAKCKAEEMEARLVGRAPTGRSLVDPQTFNDFDFRGDAAGRVCPFHSHVRKSNPRSDVEPSYQPQQHRIARRGIPYGPKIKREKNGRPAERLAHGLDDGKPVESGIGLLFLCAQADIANQFEHLQSRWSDKADHPRGRPSGVDAISGQPGNVKNRLSVAEGINGAVDYKPVVTLKGGEYFFAPSISFLRSLIDL